MKINFLDEEKILQQIRWDQIFIVLTIILVLAAPALHYSYYLLQARNLENSVENLNQQVNMLEPEVERYYQLEEEVEDYQQLLDAEHQRFLFDAAMQVLGEYIPADMTLNSIDYYLGEMRIYGQARDTVVVREYTEVLGNIEVFEQAEIEELERNQFINFVLLLHIDREGE